MKGHTSRNSTQGVQGPMVHLYHLKDQQMRTHNSMFPEHVMFKGRTYDSPTGLFNEVRPAPLVKLATFCSRVRRLAMSDTLCESSLADALYLHADQYKAQFAVRKTWVTVDNQTVALGDCFERSRPHAAVTYPNFRTRVKSLQSRELLDSVSLDHALHMSYGEWVSSYGGGRRKDFLYHGDEFPAQSGKVFPSITAFLRQTGRYADRHLIWSRLKGGWCLSHALTIPAAISSRSPGAVYLLVRRSTGQVYVGLTVCGPEQRWTFHVSAAFDGSTTKLARAIREDGINGFELHVLEENIQDVETLRQREIFWVGHHQALGPNGLNTLKPGGLGGSRGKKTIVNDVEYRSQSEAARCVSKISNIPEYIARTRIVKNMPIPEHPRMHSKHPDAGTKLWRKWQALLRRYPGCVVESWVNSYDTFKADVAFNDPALHLVRTKVSAPWGPHNFQWLTGQQKIEKQHGKAIRCHDIEYPSWKSLAQTYGIGESTLKDRIRRQGLSVEEAVASPLLMARQLIGHSSGSARGAL